MNTEALHLGVYGVFTKFCLVLKLEGFSSLSPLCLRMQSQHITKFTHQLWINKDISFLSYDPRANVSSY